MDNCYSVTSVTLKLGLDKGKKHDSIEPSESDGPEIGQFFNFIGYSGIFAVTKPAPGLSDKRLLTGWLFCYGGDMATPKAKTLQQRFGFRDGDLKTPKHDEMMLWLDENMASFLVDNGLWKPAEYTPANMERQKIEAEAAGAHQYSYAEKKAFKDLKFDDLPPLPDNKDELTIKWEFPITSGRNRYIIGFIDMVVLANCSWRYSLSEQRGWYPFAYEERAFYIEIKTKIPSLGELIRQIRMYQVHARGKWIVLCPDDRFKKPLAGQKITLIKYNPSGQMGLL